MRLPHPRLPERAPPERLVVELQQPVVIADSASARRGQATPRSTHGPLGPYHDCRGDGPGLVLAVPGEDGGQGGGARRDPAHGQVARAVHGPAGQPALLETEPELALASACAGLAGSAVSTAPVRTAAVRAAVVRMILPWSALGSKKHRSEKRLDTPRLQTQRKPRSSSASSRACRRSHRWSWRRALGRTRWRAGSSRRRT